MRESRPKPSSRSADAGNDRQLSCIDKVEPSAAGSWRAGCKVSLSALSLDGSIVQEGNGKCSRSSQKQGGVV